MKNICLYVWGLLMLLVSCTPENRVITSRYSWPTTRETHTPYRQALEWNSTRNSGCPNRVRPSSRLSSRWEYLGKAFGIDGVPTYLVIDRAGDVKYKSVGFPGVAKMKEELLKVAE